MNRFIVAACVSILVSGCSWGLKTPARGGAAKFAVAPLTASPPARCASLSDRASTWGAVAVGAAALAGTSGIGAIPAPDRDSKIALGITAAALGAVATVATFVSQDAAASWAKEECGTPVDPLKAVAK